MWKFEQPKPTSETPFILHTNIQFLAPFCVYYIPNKFRETKILDLELCKENLKLILHVNEMNLDAL